MFQNYLKIALKNLLRHRTVSGINLLGLSVGFAVFGLIVLFLLHERSFDRFHSRYDRLCRVNTTMQYPGASASSIAYASWPMGPFLKETFSRDVEGFCRLVFLDKEFVLKNGETSAAVKNVFAVDSNFFQTFDFQLLRGEAKAVFSKPNNVVLTRKLAEQLFGSIETAIGGTVSKSFVGAISQRDTTAWYQVSGVVENPPANSHLQFDALFTHAEKPYWAAWSPEAMTDWHSLTTFTYLTLRSPQTDLAALQAQIPEQLKTRMQGSQNVAHELQPMSEIHLGSKHLTADVVANFGQFDRQYLYIFGAIGLFVLLIACVNYSNLSTVLAGRRAKEIAVRKAIGANRKAVIQQFMGEAVLTSGIALALAFVLMYVAQPLLEELGYPMEAFSRLPTIPFIGGAAALTLTLGIISGAYPAFFIERLAPAKVLRGNQTDSRQKRNLVPVLVTAQFAIAVALIAGTLVVQRQMQFLQKADLGYQPAQILTLDMGMANMMKGTKLKAQIGAVPGVEGVALSDQALGNGLMQNGVRFVKDGKKEHVALPRFSVDEDFMPLYNMKMVAGRSFAPTKTASATQYIINETLAQKIGWTPEQAVGQPFTFSEMQETGSIVGVVKDFHFTSLHRRIEPMAMRAIEWTSILHVKVAAADLPATLRRLEEVWKNTVTDKPFDYKFLDEQFAQTYAAEQRLNRLAGLGAGLAIFIACLGLFALAMFTAQARTKEIGIRKVLGASVTGITGLLAKDFLKLVIASFAIAFPVAYFLMQKWLADFAYRVDIQWWIFAVAGATAVAVAFLTVGFQSVKAALANPVKSLRSE
jgi:putative ABC transport system permease protein